MALRRLKAAVMLIITGRWLTTDRAILESDPALLSVIVFLEAAHRVLVTTHAQIGSAKKRIQELTQLLGDADAHHDRFLRGIFTVLSGEADLAETEAEAEQILELRHRLMPLGLSGGQRTYREQAGNAKLARERYTAEDRALTDQIVARGRTLTSRIEEWMDTADDIGEKNAERHQLAGDTDDSVTSGDLHRARLGWIKAVNLFLNTLDFTNFDADTRRRLLADLKDASAKSSRARADQVDDTDDDFVEPHIEEADLV